MKAQSQIFVRDVPTGIWYLTVRCCTCSVVPVMDGEIVSKTGTDVRVVYSSDGSTGASVDGAAKLRVINQTYVVR